MLPVEMLSPSELYGYVQYLKRAGLAADRPELTLWQSISMPLSALAMVILAIPYVLGPIRQVSAGKRMLHGGLIGASFHAGRQLIDPARIPGSSTCGADNSEPCGGDTRSCGLAVSAAVMKRQPGAVY